LRVVAATPAFVAMVIALASSTTRGEVEVMPVLTTVAFSATSTDAMSASMGAKS
jgi:hypothetical protein